MVIVELNNQLVRSLTRYLEFITCLYLSQITRQNHPFRMQFALRRTEHTLPTTSHILLFYISIRGIVRGHHPLGVVTVGNAIQVEKVGSLRGSYILKAAA
jgi:hypothetical protein